MLLQFFNIAILNAFWPLFADIAVHLLAAMFSVCTDYSTAASAITAIQANGVQSSELP
jgi:hypothetical protein